MEPRELGRQVEIDDSQLLLISFPLHTGIPPVAYVISFLVAVAVQLDFYYQSSAFEKADAVTDVFPLIRFRTLTDSPSLLHVNHEEIRDPGSGEGVEECLPTLHIYFSEGNVPPERLPMPVGPTGGPKKSRGATAVGGNDAGEEVLH